MTEQMFIENLTELMDTEAQLTMDTRLAEIEEWDSLSHVTFVAMCVSDGKDDVKSQDVRAAQHVRDLYRLFEGEV